MTPENRHTYLNSINNSLIHNKWGCETCSLPMRGLCKKQMRSTTLGSGKNSETCYFMKSMGASAPSPLVSMPLQKGNKNRC